MVHEQGLLFYFSLLGKILLLLLLLFVRVKKLNACKSGIGFFLSEFVNTSNSFKPGFFMI